MKLEMITVVFLCVGAAQAQMTPSLDELLIKINTLEETVNALTKNMKVAFSATLSSSMEFKFIGPNTDDIILVYENAYTNIGNAYDSSTGIFTAPVKGVYFFNFVVFNPHAIATGVNLLKNGKLVVSATDNPPALDTEDTSGNSATLLLEQGDRVYLKLWANRRIYSDGNKRNTFSGHLLFTM